MTGDQLPMDGAQERTVQFGRLWDRVVARRSGIAILVTAATLITAAVAFLLPPWYQANASLMPPSEDVSFGIGTLLKGIGVPGVKVPSQATPAEVFKAILESRRINEAIVRRFDLQRRYRKKYMVDTIKELHRHARFAVDDVGLILVSAEDKDPQRAADMANAYCEELDRFNRESRMTRGGRVRRFIGARLDSTRAALDAAEQRLTRYEAEHKAVALSAGESSAIDAAARAYATRASLELRLGVLRSFSVEGTDEERQILTQLAQLDRQFARLPRTSMELARLVRDVKVGEQLHLLLTGQYEDARITEARDVATVDVLDVATVPERKVRPRRLQMIAIAFLFSLAAGVAYATMRESDGESAAPPARA
jgi:uncharacterized protein involved in exopolysaccharide biosynthesis